MKINSYRTILYFISLVTLCTIVIQFYWNYRNYQEGKQQLSNEILSSLDSAIDSYFIDLAEKNTLAITLKEGDENVMENAQVKNLFKYIDNSDNGLKAIENIEPERISEINVIRGSQTQIQDSLSASVLPIDENGGDSNKLLKATHSSEAVQLASRVILSLSTDTLELDVINEYIKKQLEAKNLDIKYYFVYTNPSKEKQDFNQALEKKDTLHITSNSAYLPKKSHFDFYFTNIGATVIKRNLLGLFLSTMLIMAVFGSLLFLLKIINRQKNLAELKNDLISNITHEFKTPISTVKVALEGIEFFNPENDPVKTKTYLQVSNNQLNKLQVMVEKLLETATLDGDNLELKKEEISLTNLISDLVEKYKIATVDKNFTLTVQKDFFIKVDPFHIENAINNILDNAVKYGGNQIEVQVISENEMVQIIISDNGRNLLKSQADQIFEKFYRVPKGNTHDIKGFGIGLYYTKSIIEKHGGTIDIVLNKKTNFEIKLPKNA
ncbi:sensor histidine kinase [Salegentibacter sp. HM20]